MFIRTMMEGAERSTQCRIQMKQGVKVEVLPALSRQFVRKVTFICLRDIQIIQNRVRVLVVING